LFIAFLISTTLLMIVYSLIMFIVTCFSQWTQPGSAQITGTHCTTTSRL